MTFPLDGLAAYWPLNETSGTRFDVHGTTHLTPVNGAGAAPGRLKLGVQLQQVNSQYLGHDTTPPIETGNINFSIAAWINPSTVTQAIVVGKDALTGRDYLLDISPASHARFSVSRNSGAADVESTETIIAGAWQFLVARHDAAAKTISIRVNNGPWVTASTKNVPPNVSGSEFRIGSRVGASIAEHFDGVVDEVGVWKLSLDDAACDALWNAGEGLEYPVAPTELRPPLVAALRARLLAVPDVTAVVDDRIYTLEFPQSLTAPALRLMEIDRISSMQLRGDVGIRRARVQVDAVESNAHGDPYVTAHQLAQAVRGDLRAGAPSGLVGYRGDLSGILIDGIHAVDQREFYDAPTRLVRVEQDFVIWFHV